MLMSHSGRTPTIAESTYLASGARVIGDVIIGQHSSVWFNAVVRGDVNFIRIGDRTNVQDGTVIHVTNKTHSTHIGDGVTIGHNCTLHGCTIGDHCLIGIGAIVLDGVNVGTECLIAAGALIVPGTVIPPRSMVMGAPARVKRMLTDEEVEHLHQSAENYIGYIESYLEPGC